MRKRLSAVPVPASGVALEFKRLAGAEGEDEGPVRETGCGADGDAGAMSAVASACAGQAPRPRFATRVPTDDSPPSGLISGPPAPQCCNPSRPQPRPFSKPASRACLLRRQTCAIAVDDNVRDGDV